MTEKAKELTITEQIDIDEGLKTKRKLLTVTSLILLALSFSGAKVEEANTFILKLSFENQKGLSVLLVIAVIFLLIRYYNYAYKYHQMLFNLWSGRLLKNSFFLWSSPHEPEYYGLICDLSPKDFDLEDLNNRQLPSSVNYKSDFLIFKKLIYSWGNEHGEDYYQEVPIKAKPYFKVLRLEAKLRFLGFFSHRENLDIMAPYMLGILAISSFVFDEQFQCILNMIAKN